MALHTAQTICSCALTVRVYAAGIVSHFCYDNTEELERTKYILIAVLVDKSNFYNISILLRCYYAGK